MADKVISAHIPEDDHDYLIVTWSNGRKQSLLLFYGSDDRAYISDDEGALKITNEDHEVIQEALDSFNNQNDAGEEPETVNVAQLLLEAMKSLREDKKSDRLVVADKIEKLLYD